MVANSAVLVETCFAVRRAGTGEARRGKIGNDAHHAATEQSPRVQTPQLPVQLPTDVILRRQPRAGVHEVAEGDAYDLRGLMSALCQRAMLLMTTNARSTPSQTAHIHVRHETCQTGGQQIVLDAFLGPVKGAPMHRTRVLPLEGRSWTLGSEVKHGVCIAPNGTRQYHFPCVRA